MPQLGVLFSTHQLSGDPPESTAFRLLFQALRNQVPADCLLYKAPAEHIGAHGVRTPLVCVVVECAGRDDLRQVEAAMKQLPPNPLLPVENRFLPERAARALTLEYIARWNGKGELVDCQTRWVRRTWAEVEERRVVAKPVAPDFPPERPRRKAPTRPPTPAEPKSYGGWLAIGCGVFLTIALSGVGAVSGWLDPLLAQGVFGMSAMLIIEVALISGLFWAMLCWMDRFSRRKPQSLMTQVAALVNDGQIDEVLRDLIAGTLRVDPFARRTRSTLHFWKHGAGLPAVGMLLEQESAAERRQLDLRLHWIGATALLMPIAGLMGGIMGQHNATPNFVPLLGGLIGGVILWLLERWLRADAHRLLLEEDRLLREQLLPLLAARSATAGNALPGAQTTTVQFVDVLRQATNTLTQAIEAHVQEQRHQLTSGMDGKAGLERVMQDWQAKTCAAAADQVKAMDRLTDSLQTLLETIRLQSDQQGSQVSEGLAEVHDALAELGPVLAELRQPIVFQAVPVKARAASAAD